MEELTRKLLKQMTSAVGDTRQEYLFDCMDEKSTGGERRHASLDPMMIDETQLDGKLVKQGCGRWGLGEDKGSMQFAGRERNH